MKPGSPNHPVAEGSIALLAAVAFFLLTDAIPIQGDVVPIAVLGGIYVWVVLVAARWRGPLFAVPLAIAGGLGFDSFYIPPYREFGSTDWQNWLVIAIYISMGVLIGIVGAHSQRRAEASELARGHLLEEQAALRRVATLVAEGARPDDVFGAVAREVGQVLGVDATHMGRYGPDGTVIRVASWSRTGDNLPVGTRSAIKGDSVTASVFETGRPTRIDSYDDASGPIAATMRKLGVRSSVGVPITVQGRPWGLIVASTKAADRLPGDIEARTAAFTELVATAIANTNAEAQVRSLAEEQAALRRVAALIAQEPSPDQVFATVAHEVGRLLAVENTKIYRYEADGTATSLADWGEPVTATVGTRMNVEGEDLAARVLMTRRPARVDDYAKATGAPAVRARELGIRFAVGIPIIVEGRLWGVMIAATRQAEPLPVEAESRIGQFTQLVATAIANADARAEVARLAEEQAALRRVATLVARGAPPAAVFEAVATETAKVLDSETVSLLRYEPDATAIVIVAQSAPRPVLPSRIGLRIPLEGENVAAEVMRTRAPARIDDWAVAAGSMAEISRESGIRASVGVPIFVEGSLWGLLAAGWVRDPPPSDTEVRMKRFAELADTAIANAESRAQLTASRARVLAAGDDARRRVVRDLHDGAQQRLVSTIVTLKLALRARREKQEDTVESLITEGLVCAEEANAALRELAHGILPSALTRGGLRAGISALVSRIDLPVEVQVPDERFPAGLEASAYFIVAEALTNVVKHAQASCVEIHAARDGEILRLEVRDDGVGGAGVEAGSGLVGLKDRAAAIGGRLSVESLPGQGTVITATLPADGVPSFGTASGPSR